ncbi:MAG: hypothetical protein C0501_15875 [Isosphaera sp.]|nr:hypothetical protein [Isosphaera sp.]
MASSFLCPTCRGVVRVARAPDADGTVRCPWCGDRVPVPDDDPPPAADDEAPWSRATGRPPRPRRREPAGLGGRAAVGAVVGVGVLVAVVVGAVLLTRPPAAAWQPHESAGGGFRVELPAAPRADLAEQAGAQLPGWAVEGTTFRGADYHVLWGEIPDRRRQTDDQVLEEAYRGLVARHAARGEKGPPLTVGGFPARDMYATADNGDERVFRVVVAHTRAYVLVVGGGRANPRGADARRFLDSFTITDPKLLALTELIGEAARERKQAEEDAKARAAAERARAETVAAGNAAFLAAPFAGRRPPDPRAVAGKSADVLVYPFDTELSPGVVVADEFREKFVGAVLGPGVRDRAAYLLPAHNPVGVGYAHRNGERARKVFTTAPGYTLAGWVRTRSAGVEVFRAAEAPPDVLAELTVARGVVTARVAGGRAAKGRAATVLTHPWPADGGWHHLALVNDRQGAEPEARLYLDGVRVGSGQGAVKPWAGVDIWAALTLRPDGERRRDGEPLGQDRDEVVAAVDDLVMVARPLSDGEVAALSGRGDP